MKRLELPMRQFVENRMNHQRPTNEPIRAWHGWPAKPAIGLSPDRELHPHIQRLPAKTVMQRRRHMLAGICLLMSFAILVIAQPASQSAPVMPGTAPQAGASAKAPAAANGGIESVKALIKATDEEWKVIGPKLQALVAARQTVTTYTTPAAGRGGFGGPGFPNMGPDSFAGPSNNNGPGGRGRGGFPPGFDPANPTAGRGFPPGFDPANPAAGRGFPPGFDPAAMAAMGGGRGGPGGFGPDNAVSSALAELKKAVDDPTSPPAQIKDKLAAVRGARQRAAADLAMAQKALLALLTADQEVIVVSLGYLD